jgi:hypothetical protein
MRRAIYEYEEAPHDLAVGEHDIDPDLPLAGRTGELGAFEDEAAHSISRSTFSAPLLS